MESSAAFSWPGIQPPRALLRMLLLVLLLSLQEAEHPLLNLQTGVCWESGKYHPLVFPVQSQSGPCIEHQELFSLPGCVSSFC